MQVPRRPLTRVADVMSHGVITVRADTPVVDDAGMVEGFVSRTDILRAVVHDPPLDIWS